MSRINGLALVASLLGVMIGVVPFSPLASNDGPSHALPGVVFERWDQIDLLYQACYKPNFPLTNHGAELLWLLDGVVAPDAAARFGVIFLCAMLGIACGGLSIAVSGRIVPAAVVIPVLGGPLVLGLFPFLTGSAFGIGGVAAFLMTNDRRFSRAGSGLLVLSALCHPVAATCAGMTMVAMCRNWRQCVFALAATLPAAAISGIATLSSGHYLVSKPTEVSHRLLPHIAPASETVAVCVLVFAAAVFFFSVRLPRHDDNTLVRRAAIVGGAFLALSALLPEDLGAWQFAGRRLLVLGLTLTLIGASRNRLLLVLTSICGGAAALTFAIEASAVSTNAQNIHNDIAALDIKPAERFAVQRRQPRSFSGLQTPTFGFAHLVSMRHGGISLMGHLGDENLHHLLADCVPSTYLPGTGLRPLELKEPLTPGEMESAKVLTWGSHSEAIVMLGDEADRRFFRDVAGMVVHGESSVFVADTPSCRLTVAVTASGSIGYWPFKEPARVLHSGTNMLTLPCGPIWLTTTDACLLDGVALSKASLIGPYVLTMRPGSSPDIQCVAPESDEPPP